MTRYIIVDIESTGPTPASGIMTEFGAVDLESLESFSQNIYLTEPDPDIPAKPVIIREEPLIDPDESMKQFADWLDHWNDRVVFVSDNPAFDFMWIAYGFDKAGLQNPFGFSGRRIGDLYAGLTGKWKNTSAWKKHRKTKHDHTGLADAMGNAEALRFILSQFEQKI